MAGLDDIDCSNFFDQIDDLLDIPDETCADNGSVESDFFFDDFKDFPSIWTQSEDFSETIESVFSDKGSNSVSVPYEKIEQMEWFSNVVEDSSAGSSLTTDVPSTVVSPSCSPLHFQTTSPLSVLESSDSSYVGGKFVPVKQNAAVGKPSHARSERPRPPTFIHRAAPENGKGGNSECESYDKLSNSSKIRKSDSNTDHKKKKKKKKTKISFPAKENQNDDSNPLTPFLEEVRKCQHCEITKTPQWRAGPNGPKTLCNACGVRYKSGRLFPEYRPAASPTFVPTIHSNSHKKVLEMRVKTTSNVADFPLIEDSLTEWMPES